MQPLLWDNIMNETSFSACTQKHTKIGKKNACHLDGDQLWNGEA